MNVHIEVGVRQCVIVTFSAEIILFRQTKIHPIGIDKQQIRINFILCLCSFVHNKAVYQLNYGTMPLRNPGLFFNHIPVIINFFCG